MGHLGGVSDVPIVLLGSDFHHPAKAHLPGQALHHGHRLGGGLPRHQNVRGADEDAGVAGGKAALLLAGHGVARHKLVGGVLGELLHGGADFLLDAAGVGEDAPGLEPAAVAADEVQNVLGIEAEVHHIGALQIGEGGLAVNGAAGAGVQQHVVVYIHAQHPVGGVLFQRLGQRAPDEAQAYNDDLHGLTGCAPGRRPGRPSWPGRRTGRG